MLDQPVPPTFTESVEEADHVPELITATPVNPLESIPVPPLVVATVPVKFDSDRQELERE